MITLEDSLLVLLSADALERFPRALKGSEPLSASDLDQASVTMHTNATINVNFEDPLRSGIIGSAQLCILRV